VSAPKVRLPIVSPTADKETPEMSALHRPPHSHSGNLGRAHLGALALGACLLAALFAAPAALAVPTLSPFAIEPGSFHITPSSYQAGAHADLVTAFNFNHTATAAEETYGDVDTTIVNLPPGFSGNATAMPTCTDAQLVGFECPPDSQVGQISFAAETFWPVPSVLTIPVNNMETTTGVTAALGFNALITTQILHVSVRPEDSGLTITSPSIDDVGEIHQVSVDIWGVPAAASHTAQRGRWCLAVEGSEFCLNPGGEEVNIPVKPFLSNPTSCSQGPLKTTMTSDSWEEQENWSEESTEIAPLTECERLPFSPSLELQPSTRAAESPTGLATSLLIPQTWELPNTLSTSNLKKAVVTLPEGFSLNPSAGSGLGVCTPAEYKAETAFSAPGAGCPSESKLGTVEAETPVLTEKALGSVYLAKPFDNPFDSLLALYIVAKIPDRGIIVKTAGEIEPNPITGQVVATFDNLPQVPFSKFTLKFSQGATSPLASPPACDAYTGTADLSPWSEPANPRHISNSFQMTEGVHGGPCPSGGVPPFAPQVRGGSYSVAAGANSPFYLHILRNDGEQEITKFSMVLPPGLSADLSGVPFCPDGAIEAARTKSGTQETAKPSCPASSEIGHTFVGAGVGGVLAQAPGKVYLAGPYHGSALSVVSITSATVGPFDLGTVVIRFALRINPITAQAEVDSTGSDPIPHIIDGIITHVRDIRVWIDRPAFTLNPTSCNQMSVAATVTGAGADFTNPADANPVTVITPYQVANCSSLAFGPELKASTSGKTSRSSGASLSVKLTYPSAPQGSEANIAKVKVELPKQLPSRLTTLQKACTAAQFEANPAGCPAASIVGHAKALTPIVPVPLEGPAYFVSHGGEQFPSLVVVLQGYGITVDLVGSTSISKTGITSSTFKTVPDVPVGAFELTLPEGPFSALGANRNLCKNRSKLKMPTEFVAQNGALIRTNTKIAVTGCPRAHKAAHRKRHGAPRHGKRKG
jgi:hypothetical protein